MIKDTVLIPIYRSFGLRYLISTNIIRKLSNKYKIVLLIDIKKKKFYKKIFINDNVIYEDIKIKELNKFRFPRIMNFLFILRKFFNGNTQNYKNKSIYVNKIRFYEELKKKKIFFLVLFVSFFLNRFFFLRKFFIYIVSSIDKKNSVKKIFEKHKPKLLITTSYGYDFDQYFINLSKKYFCKSVSIIYSWDNPTAKGYKLAEADYYFAWNKTMKKELSIFHDINPKKILISGISHWDSYFKNSLKKNKIKIKGDFFRRNKILINKNIILYFSSSPRDFPDSYDKIDKICNFLNKRDDTILIARMHPHYMDDRLCKKYTGKINRVYKNRLLKKYKGKLFFKNPVIKKFGRDASEVIYPINDICELSKLYCSSKILLTEYSTTLLEGCIFQIPVINVAIGKFRNTNHSINLLGKYHHLLNLKKYNAIYEVQNYKNLRKTIYNLLNKKDKLKKNRINLVNKELNSYKGKSSKNIITQLQKII